MKKCICLILFSLALAACGEKPAPAAAEPNGEEKMFAAYVGTFDGVLPCASCNGIDTELTLNADGTFSLIEFYLSTESDLYLTEGAWKLSDDSAYAVLTPSSPNDGHINLYYALKGIDLVKLDIHAKPIESTHNYILRRK